MGASLSDIKLEYQMLWLQSLVYFFISCAVYRYQIIQARRHAMGEIQKMKNRTTMAKVKKVVVPAQPDESE
jgi:ABC-2 type transport system permease protein